MILTYEELMNTIPEETKIYVKKVLMYLYYYKNKKMQRRTANYKYFEDYYNVTNSEIYQAELLVSSLIGLLELSQTSSIVAKYGFDGSNIVFQTQPEPLAELLEKETFNYRNELFCFYSDHTKYTTLSPLDIAANALRICKSKELVFEFFGIEKEINNTILQLSIDKHTKQDSQKELTVYENLPYDTINYIETASKIRTLLLHKLSTILTVKENDYLKKDDNYLVPLSLLLALYEYDKEEKNIIEKYLTSKNITLNKIYEKININLTYEIVNTKRNMESIEQLYIKYWKEGKNKDIQTQDINIINILNNLFDRNFTHSIIIEKIINELSKNTKDIIDIEKEIELYKNLYENITLDQKLKEFNSKIRKDTQEFINFTCKSYQVLLKKIKSGKYNREILSKEEDIDNLAVYLASHFYQTDIDSFFNYYGVTFEKIIKLLNIEISKEEIEAEVLDKKILLERFKRFVTNGLNIQSEPNNITMNDVSLNLCNREFNRSMLMENLFEEIRRDIDLPSNFLNMLNKFIKNQQKEIKRLEKEEYFKNLPIENLKYLTNVCTTYKGLIEKTNIKEKYCDELIIVLSLLLGLDDLENSKAKELLKHIGISFELIYSHFGIINKKDGELDIKLLKTKFNKYIYEGRNKTNNSPTIQDIALNIFNEELYTSTELKEYLHILGLSYNTFKEPQKLIKEFEDKVKKEEEIIKQEERNYQAKKELEHYTKYDVETIRVFNSAVDIYNKIIDIYNKNKEKYKNIKTYEDIEILSFILSILETNITQTKFFKKHNLNKNDILEYLELPSDYQNMPSTKEKQDTLANVFIKYLKKDTKELLASLNENEFYQKIINKFVTNKTIFEKELVTGKNYEETLTLQERIELIKNTPLEILDTTTINNILNFGNSLGIHASYIQDEYPKLMQSNEITHATEEIKKLVSSAYIETEVPQPQGVLQKLFGTIPETKKEIKLNIDIVNSLKPNIEIQINKLHTEAKKLSELKEYMEEYYKKNKEYIIILNQSLNSLNKQLQELDKEDIFRIYNLKSYITILENKVETLKMTDALIKQEYIKLNQVIVNHCITINSLIMSRNTLLPLISTEMLIGKGINTEKTGNYVTKQILTLLTDLVSKNVDKTQEVLENLKSTNLSEEQLAIITSKTNDQINQIINAKLLEENIENRYLNLEVTSINQESLNEKQEKKLIKKI